jgi:hypothetical protein
MSNLTRESEKKAKESNAAQFILRVLWIAVRLAAVLVFIDRGGTFFYQGF